MSIINILLNFLFCIFGVIIGSILGFLSTIGVTLIIEWLRTPKLKLKILDKEVVQYNKHTDIKNKAEYIRLQVENKRLKNGFEWLYRNPALNTKGKVTFYDYNTKKQISEVMPIRWTASRQPIPMSGICGKNKILIQDFNIFSDLDNRDIYVGDFEPIDVIAWFDNEKYCYGFNNESYFHGYRNNKYKLSAGVYTLKVKIQSCGFNIEEYFKLSFFPNKNIFEINGPIKI